MQNQKCLQIVYEYNTPSLFDIEPTSYSRAHISSSKTCYSTDKYKVFIEWKYVVHPQKSDGNIDETGRRVTSTTLPCLSRLFIFINIFLLPLKAKKTKKKKNQRSCLSYSNSNGGYFFNFSSIFSAVVVLTVLLRSRFKRLRIPIASYDR